jgi:Repeat of unknown function (DUF346)
MPTYGWSSTRRLAQLTGDYDPDPGGLPLGIDGVSPHVNFTGPWGVEGVDLGANTEHAGKLFVFFGDVPQTGGRQWPPHDADLVAWIRKPDVWPGALRLEPVEKGGVFHPFSVRLNEPAAGDPATLVFGAQQHVFYRGRDGAINHCYWEPPNCLRHNQWSTLTSAPPSAGAPATMVTEGQQHVFYRGVDGNIEHLLWGEAAPDQVFHDQWTSRAGAPLAAGDPATIVTEGQQHVFYRGLDGNIEHLLWSAAAPDQVFHDQWTSRAGAPLAAGDPVTMVTEGQQHVFYRGLDGNIEHLLWSAAAPDRVFHDQWTSRAGAPLAKGDPATMVTERQQHVFYRGLDGNIEHLLWSAAAPDQVFHDQWTSRAGAPLAKGDPATTVTEGQQHVFYRGIDGNIEHLLWGVAAPDRVFHDQWTSRAGAPLAAGDPATMATQGQQHVFYRGVDGALNHVAWDEASAVFLHDQWTTLVPLGGETPTGAFSFNTRAFVFVWRGGASSLTSSSDPSAPAPFLWHFPLSRWGEVGHTAFLQVAPYVVVVNDELRSQIPEIPKNVSVGLIMFGHGLGQEGWGVYLAWMPLRSDRDPAREDVLYYQGPSRPWGPEQGLARRLFATRFGWSSLSVGRIPGKEDWIVVSQRTGVIKENRDNGTWDEPIVARIAATPWAIGDALEVPIFSPVREGARGRYMAQIPDAPWCQWAPSVHPSFAYGAYLIDYYTEWSARRRIATLVYLLSTGCPYQVQVMETQIVFK